MHELIEITPFGIERVAFYAAFLVGIAVFVFIIRKYIRLLLQFNKIDYKVDIGKGIKRVLKFVLGQRRLLDDPFSGTAHFLIFWGFLIIAFGTINFFGKGFSSHFYIPLLSGMLKTPFAFLLDLFSFLVVVGVLGAVVKRYLIRPERLSQSPGALIILVLIFGLMAFDLLSDGFNIAAQQHIVKGAFIGNYLGSIFWNMPKDTAVLWSHVFWWAHFVFFMSMLNYVPTGKHMHVFSSIFNVFLTNDKAGTALSSPNLEDEELETFGITKVEEHSWKDLLDAYSCTECGRCQDVCPAYKTGKPLSPKQVTMQLRAHAEKKAPFLYDGKSDDFKEDIIRDVMTEDVIWSCTTCYACQRACPLFIKQFTKLIDYRRALVLNEGAISKQGALALKNLEKSGDPWGLGQSARAEWYKDLDVKHISDKPDAEWLFWVGCAGALDDRNIKVSRDTVKLMNAAGVDFAILGTDETCTGDAARRLGDEYTFQTMAQANIEILNEAGVKKIFTNCPHCFNTLKNEYPDFNGNYEVVHTHQLLEKLIKSGKLKIDTGKIKREKLPNGGSITIHDSCYLGRHNNIYQPARTLVDLVGGRVEMKRSRDNSFCCGAGGGGMWLEENIGTRINVERTEQCLETGAKTIGVACPFCMTMLEDGLKTKDEIETHSVLEITEILAAGV
ncbi:MAG: (Fe-S)-binding protein [candidate division Zixibacteria bacterium]|nr:(Fe-S)-binding protein [candidate division Zixibacteria bacterium]